MSAPQPSLIVDTREPWPEHPWKPYFPPEVQLVRQTLETGDFCLAGAQDGAVIERKSPTDFLACVGRERERFERELLRARFCGSFAIVVEGSLAGVMQANRGLHPNVIFGSVAAWTRRGFPVVFCSTPDYAANFTWRYLSQQVTEAKRLLAACA